MCIALLSMGVRFYAVAAECDWLSSQVVEKNLPHVVRVPDVEDICGADFQPFLQRRQVRGIIISGGSPRQGSSALNLRQKLDMRGQQPAQLVRIRAELEELPECASLEIVSFLENIASMPKEVQQQYTSWMGAPPILVDAATCGWVQRRRFLWLCTRRQGVSATCKPPAGWVWVPSSNASY